MIRRLFTLASALSLVLFIVTVAARIYTCRRDIVWLGEHYGLYATAGGLRFERDVAPVPPMRHRSSRPGAAAWEARVFQRIDKRTNRLVGLVLTRNYPLFRQSRTRGDDGLWDAELFAFQTSLLVPYWLAMTVNAVLPLCFAVARLRDVRRSWRMRHGLCALCGYELRATPGRCPECGAAIPQKTETRA